MKADRMSADQALQDIADYVIDYKVESEEALNTARNCLMDTIGCGLLALKYPNCTRHLGPIVPGTTVENGARVFGRSFELDPVKAAWDIGAIVRWLDFNDTWLAEEWGHPSDNLGAIMALSDYISRVTGWCAHIFEQRQNNRIIRPNADYIGPGPQKVSPIETRS